MQHCGRCDNACADEFECRDGTCVCPDGLTDCNGTCVDKTTDPSNCGACELQCDSNVCDGGTCFCESGFPCGGACVDIATDVDNCGRCGNTCDDLTETCTASQCECLPFFTLCGDACIYTPSDPMHCGSCDAPCGDGQVCAANECSETCGMELIECNGLCVDPAFDPLNCGFCGMRCTANEVCLDGMCETYDIPNCSACPCVACGDLNCCSHPTLVGQVLCSDALASTCDG
jgi:hypothetical protein